MREEFHKRKCRCRRGEQTVSDAFWPPEEIQKLKYKYKKYRYRIQLQKVKGRVVKGKKERNSKRGDEAGGELTVLDAFCLQEKYLKFKSNAINER